MSQARLGIAITTLNRSAILAKLLAEIGRLTIEDFVVVVCDDGSQDDSVEIARAAGAVVIAGDNRGVAWNKNRGLYYLLNYSQVECILLLDDDVLPTVHGWEQEWLAVTKRFGHANFAIDGARESIRGPAEASATHPSFNTKLSGICLAFSRPCLAEIGYMDTRFGKYGHEHTELTLRAIARGYGGFNAGTPYFLTISGGLKPVDGLCSSGDELSAFQNEQVFLAMKDDYNFRLPWRDEAERDILMAEMELTCQTPVRLTPEIARRYQASNPDVVGELIAAAVHWINFGTHEGREWGP